MAFGDLTSLEVVKAWLKTGENDVPADADVTLTRLITSSSEWLKGYLGRPVIAQDWEETRDGLGGQTFVFAVKPVSAVALVLINGITVPPAPSPAPGPAGIVTANGSAIGSGYVFTPTKLVIRGFIVPRLEACVTLRYTAGYARVPPEIEQACVELITWAYRGRGKEAMLSTSLGGVQTASWSQAAMHRRTQQALEQFKNVVPASGFVRSLAPTDTDPATLAAI